MKLFSVVLLSMIYVSCLVAQDNLCQGAHWSEEQGAQMMQKFAAMWDDQRSWEQRASIIRSGMVKGMGWDRVPDYDEGRVIIHSSREMDGYRVENIAIESFPGFYITGNLYQPSTAEGRLPAVLCPHGHWSKPGDIGRFRDDMQIRCGMLARMGAVVIAYDMVGYGESTQVDHRIPIALLLQTWNSKRVVDYLLSRGDVDPERIAMTGASGGGTQTFVAVALDERIKVSVPTVMVSAHFFGGCVCESGMPIHKSATHQTNNVEIAALAAPRPMLVISDGGDWTANNPTVEIPYLRRVYDAYQVTPRLQHVHFPLERHDYGRHKRAAMYNFLTNHLQLRIGDDMYDHDLGVFEESVITLQEEKDLYVFNDRQPRPEEAWTDDQTVMDFFLGDFCRDPRPTTKISIRGNAFYINDKPTYAGRYWKENKIEGLLFNARMVQGIFDDMNAETRDRWKYPDTKTWDPNRNTKEFVAAMDEWHAHGLLSFTINMQGGSPMGYGNKEWHNSAYHPDGRLRPDYMARLKKILDKADELGMAPILGLFYFGQDQNLSDDAAVVRATENVIDWLFEHRYENVLIEVANECDNKKYDRDIIKADRIHELIDLIQSKQKNGHRFLVSTSYNGNRIPHEKVVSRVDFILIHGNGVEDPARIREMVKLTKEVKGFRPMPIVFNEDDHFDFDKQDNNFLSAIRSYASWGYFDYRMDGEGFEAGYQSVPVDWKINSDRKKEFFGKLNEVTGGGNKQ